MGADEACACIVGQGRGEGVLAKIWENTLPQNVISEG